VHLYGSNVERRAGYAGSEGRLTLRWACRENAEVDAIFLLCVRLTVRPYHSSLLRRLRPSHCRGRLSREQCEKGAVSLSTHVSSAKQPRNTTQTRASGGFNPCCVFPHGSIRFSQHIRYCCGVINSWICSAPRYFLVFEYPSLGYTHLIGVLVANKQL
jgi:hypothetical protein